MYRMRYNRHGTQTRLGGLLAAHATKSGPSSTQMRHQGNQEQHQENNEQYLRDRRGAGG